MAASSQPRRLPPIADPARFRRHAIGALDAYIAGDGAKLIGHLDAAREALVEGPQRQAMPVLDKKSA